MFTLRRARFFVLGCFVLFFLYIMICPPVGLNGSLGVTYVVKRHFVTKRLCIDGTFSANIGPLLLNKCSITHVLERILENKDGDNY